MLALAEKAPEYITKPPSEHHQQSGRELQTGIRKTLRQAVELKELAYNTAKAIQPTSGPVTDSQEARAIAQSVTALCKAFADMVTIIRIERGKPLPGSLRPESKPKKSKRTQPTFSESKPD